VTKTEPTTRIVELRTGNSQVEQDAVNSHHTMGTQYVCEFRERCVINRKARVIDRPCGSDRFRVTINRDEPAIWAQSIQQPLGVAAATKGGIDVDPTLADRHHSERLLEKNGSVLKLSVH
jgi:hypothetical protein